jgi:flavin-dependent dehydrogenase
VYDAIIVGSRCAGSSTARLLAEKGHRVLMVDHAHFPSDTVSTHCVTLGGVIQLRRWGLLDRVLATNVSFVPSFTLTIGPNEFHDPLPVEDGTGTVCPRRTVLDKLLVDAAVEAGTVLREGMTVTGLLRDEQGGVVGIVGREEDANAVEERAALVIGADGTQSFVAKAAGAEVYDQRPGHGSGYYAYSSGIPADRVSWPSTTATPWVCSRPTTGRCACSRERMMTSSATFATVSTAPTRQPSRWQRPHR